MSKSKILHVCTLDSVNAIIPRFIEFVRRHFDTENQLFLTWGQERPLPFQEGPDTLHLSSLHGKRLRLFAELNNAERIIIHGLFSKHLIEALFLQPWLLKKCYWMIWGGDLYKYLQSSASDRRSVSGYLRKRVVQRIGHFVSFVKGDYELAVEHYGAKGDFVECFMYPSNICRSSYQPSSREKNEVRSVLVGNSATASNNHLILFEQLRALRDQHFQIICPLSYGERAYAEQIKSVGERLFGERFRALLEFMPFDEYVELLDEVDVAVFGHERQQSMGNTILLLGLGKKVHMRRDVTPVQFFHDLGVTVFDVDEIDLEPLPERVAIRNSRAVTRYFSESRLVDQLRRVLNN